MLDSRFRGNDSIVCRRQIRLRLESFQPTHKTENV